MLRCEVQILQHLKSKSKSKTELVFEIEIEIEIRITKIEIEMKKKKAKKKRFAGYYIIVMPWYEKHVVKVKIGTPSDEMKSAESIADDLYPQWEYITNL